MSVLGYLVKKRDEQTEVSPVESHQNGQRAGAHDVYGQDEKTIFRPGKGLRGKSS